MNFKVRTYTAYARIRHAYFQMKIVLSLTQTHKQQSSLAHTCIHSIDWLWVHLNIDQINYYLFIFLF